jgi:hypothetical protein
MTTIASSFQTWTDRLLVEWRGEARWKLNVQRRDPRFVRALLDGHDAQLKIEFVNEFLRDLRGLGEDLLLVR